MRIPTVGWSRHWHTIGGRGTGPRSHTWYTKRMPSILWSSLRPYGVVRFHCRTSAWDCSHISPFFSAARGRLFFDTMDGEPTNGELLARIVHNRYPTIDASLTHQIQLALSPMKMDEVVCLVSTYVDAVELLSHCQHTNNQFGFWHIDAVQTGPMRRWAAYCREVEHRLLGSDNDAADTQTTVFGNCRKCGSNRLEVRTKQLRRADEGATELRTCHDCGHTSRVNS